MLTRSRAGLVSLGLILVLGSNIAKTATLQVEVVDQQGNPVADAVILVPGREAGPDPDQTVVIDQIDKQFVPRVSLIRKGQLVSFPNSDNIRHHVYSFSSPKVFELKLYAGQPESPVRFDQAGIVVLGCNIHDQMVGYIVITDSGAAVKTGPDGIAVLTLQDPVEALQLWHPLQKRDITEWATFAVPDRSLPGLSKPKVLQVAITLKPEPKPAKGSGFSNQRFKQHDH